MSKTFDWRMLAPESTYHDCDCEFCDNTGDLEPIAWPGLLAFTHDGIDYVTDRFFVLRADIAPIPEKYEGPVLTMGLPSVDWLDACVTADPPHEGTALRLSTIDAIEHLGARLRRTTWPDTANGTQTLAVVIDNEHVGWALSGVAMDEPLHGYRQYREPAAATNEAAHA